MREDGVTARAVPDALILVIVVGPQASGKSTVSTALARALRELGETVVLVELDGIAGMALPTLPGWTVAQEIFETVVDRWLRAEVSCVIAEGSGSAEEVGRLLARAPAGAGTLTVALDAPFEVAYARAQADPSRMRSRERDFLARVYDRWPEERAAVAPDLVLRTHESSIDDCVEAVRDAIEGVRAAREAIDPDRPAGDVP